MIDKIYKQTKIQKIFENTKMLIPYLSIVRNEKIIIAGISLGLLAAINAFLHDVNHLNLHTVGS